MSGLVGRDHAATVVVTGLSAAFGVALLGVTSLMSQIARAQHPGPPPRTTASSSS